MVFVVPLYLLIAAVGLSREYGPAPAVAVDGHLFQLPTPLVMFDWEKVTFTE